MADKEPTMTRPDACAADGRCKIHFDRDEIRDHYLYAHWLKTGETTPVESA